MKGVLFIRHGATAGNLEKRYIGRTNEPLCDLGLTQVIALAQQNLQADVVFTSPALRTRQTAEHLFPGIGLREVPDLWETDFGAFEGKTAAELEHDPDYQAWVDSLCQGPIPGGESVSDFKNRCIQAFQQAMEEVEEGQTAAFVIHGGCIMAILEGLSDPPCGFYDHHISPGQMLCRVYETGKIYEKEP